MFGESDETKIKTFRQNLKKKTTVTSHMEDLNSDPC